MHGIITLHNVYTLVGESQYGLSPPVNGSIPFERGHVTHVTWEKPPAHVVKQGLLESFAGLGSSTNTLGKRNLPFCIQVGEDSLAGAMESHEVDTDAFNPLLISLFAQAKLSLIKDMAQCRCYIGDLEVPMARCFHTGLLLICLSQVSRRSKLPRVVET